MKLLLSYLRPHKGMIVLAIILAVINQVFSLLDPQIFRIIVDKYASNIATIPRAEFISGVGLLILAFIGVAMVSRIAKNFQDYYVNVVSQSVGASMYADGIAHSLRLPFRAFEDQQSGAVLQQLQKARTDSRDMIGQSINTVFISSLTLLLVLGYSFFVHWSIGVALLILAPILTVLVSSLGRRIKQVQGRIFAETNALAGSTTESLRNIELIKSLGLETQEIDRLNATNQKILDLELAKVKTVRDAHVLPGHGNQLLPGPVPAPDAHPRVPQARHTGGVLQPAFLLICHLLSAGRDRERDHQVPGNAREPGERGSASSLRSPPPPIPGARFPTASNPLSSPVSPTGTPGRASTPSRTCPLPRGRERASPLSGPRARERAPSSSFSSACTSRTQEGSFSMALIPVT